MKYILISFLFALPFIGQAQSKRIVQKKTCDTNCSDNCSTRLLACKLTSPELQERKATVIASLKNQVLETKEISNGFSYKFKGTDEVLDELHTFIKTERLCCGFFDFTIKVAGDVSYCWLTITGPKGTKEFIKTELEF